MSNSKNTSNGRQDTSRYSDGVYRRAHQRRLKQGNYFHFFRLYMKIMSVAEAVFIQDLENRLTCAEGNGRLDKQGFTRCSENYLIKYCGWSSQQQRTIMTKLKSRDFVETKIVKTKHGRIRCVRVNTEKVESALDATLSKKLELDN